MRQGASAFFVALFCAGSSGMLHAPAFGQQASADAARAEMQRSLNAEVLASAFNAGDVKKAEAYADDALKRGLQPVAQPPDYWQPGWDCAALTRYRYYVYSHYRDCIYYHRHYGRYW